MAVFCEFCGQPSQFMTAGQVARALGLAPKTIRKYIKQGRFPGTTKMGGEHNNGEYRIPVTAVVPLMTDERR